MAFKDPPIVDDKAGLSEQSVLAVRNALTINNGFISREETRDYGVDVDVELIIGGGASSKKFPIQIKSSFDLDIVTVGEIQYVSIDFKTSRLGYLCNRPPAYGIIAVYNEKNALYFDYVENIYQRLCNERGGNEWLEQDTVRIHIPLTSLPDSLGDLHTRMVGRFDSHDRLISAYGPLYQIPPISSGARPKSFDFNDVNQVFEALKTHGMGLIIDREYNMLYGMLERITLAKANESPEVLLVGSIVYGQVGKIFECKYYVSRATRFADQYQGEDRVLLDYTRCMLDYRMGTIDRDQFSQALKELKGRSTNVVNSISFAITLVYMRFLVGVEEAMGDTSLLKDIEDIFDQIDKSDASVTDKALLMLFNLENLHNYGTDLLIKEGGRYRIQVILRVQVPMEKRLRMANTVLNMINGARKKAIQIFEDAGARNDSLVRATAASLIARFFFVLSFQRPSLGLEGRLPLENADQVYLANLRLCYEAVGLFLGLGAFQEAYNTLGCAYELETMYQIMYGAPVGDKSLDEITSVMRNIENDIGIGPYQPVVRPALDEKLRMVQVPWADHSDEDLEDVARRVLDACDLPEDRLANILLELDGHRIFERACDNDDIELLTGIGHTKSKETMFLEPPVFVLRSKVSGIESRKTTNIHEALEQFSTILRKKKTE